MTPGQQRTHRLLWVVLGPLVMIGLAVALSAKQPIAQTPTTEASAQESAE